MRCGPGKSSRMWVNWAFGLGFALLLVVSAPAAEPVTELLWPAGAPQAKGTAPQDKPTLVLYPAAKEHNTGAAIVICPGGGYGALAMNHEGHEIAKWLNGFGVSAFICDYRHRGKGYGHPAPLEDAQRAIRTVRQRADEWGVNPQRIGILGFSAGGHLASTAATHFDAGQADSPDPIQRVSSRPDFAVLCYAVIAFDEPFTHRGSQQNLLGKDAPAELVRSYSNEKQVTAQTPPTFLWHTDEDTGVPPENSVVFYQALKKMKVPAELHIFEKGRHGLGLAADVPGTNQWPQLCQAWLQNRGLLTPAAEAGFLSLFDGKSLDGWEGNPQMFRVQDGAIVAGSLQAKIPNNEFLCTKKEYGDFELRLDARLVGQGDNAGVQFRSQRIPNHHEVTGYQCDIGRMQDQPIWGWLYDESRRRKFLSEAADPAQLAKQLKADGWNQLVIRCVGPRIQIWVNGVATVDYTEAEAEIARRGILGLQIHGGPPAEASYRNIRIRELP